MQNFRYTIAFDSVFGGHWNLTDHTHVNADGTYTDSFRGTVSDTSIQTRSPVTTLIGPVTGGSLQTRSDHLLFVLHHYQ